MLVPELEFNKLSIGSKRYTCLALDVASHIGAEILWARAIPYVYPSRMKIPVF